MNYKMRKMMGHVVAAVISVSMAWGSVSMPVMAESGYTARREHLLNYMDIPDDELTESTSVHGNKRLFRNRIAAVPAKWGYDDFKDYMPDLRDQGMFGSCWAQSSMALAEINLGKKGLLDKPDFSEVQLTYFTYNWETDPLGGTAGDSNVGLFSSGDYLGFGGNVKYGENILASWTGASWDAGALKYPGYFEDAPQSLDDKYAYNSDIVHLMNYRNIDLNPSSEEDIMQAKQLIMDWGALGVSFYAQDGTYMAVNSGTYKESTNAYYDPKAHGFTSGGKYYARTNHAVTIVGWDDNYPAANFEENPGHDGAWLIRNSWTKGSYEDNQSYEGYFWMSYYNKDLGDCVAFDFDLNNNYHNNYQYDGGMNSAAEVRQNSIKGANVFKAHASEAGEVLKAVSFCTNKTNEDYTIEIFVSDDPINEANMETGSPEEVLRGRTSFAGNYSVPLNNPINLKPGQYFAVVLKLDKAGEIASISYEKTNTVSGWYSSMANIEEGQSYLYNNIKKTWEDVLTVKRTAILSSIYESMGNLRIKAFTDNIGESKPAVTEPEQDPEPVTPEQPEEPEPSTPEQPAEPEPATPEQPVKPEPTTPEQPVKPEPTTPVQPVKPEPSRPVQPTEPQPSSDSAPVNKPGMELNDDKLVVRVNKTSRAIKADLENDSIASVSINKPSVAKVSFSGNTVIVKAGKKKGRAKVTVRSQKGIVRSFSLETQTGKVTTKKITGIPKKLTLSNNCLTKTYRVVATPDRISTGEVIKVKTSGKKVATASMDQNTGILTIKAVNKGTASITVSAGKKKATIKVNVK